MKELIKQIIFGIIIVDLLVGFFHWIEDTYFCYSSSNSIIREIAQDNDLHHYYPRSILSYSYFENCTVTIPLVIIILLLLYTINKTFFMKYKYSMLVILIFGSISNIFHKFLHMRRCEKSDFLNFLQDNYIIANSEQHKDHHINSTDNYCVILYFNNVLLKKIYFWYYLEKILYILFGIKRLNPKNYDKYTQIQNKFHKLLESDCPKVLTKNEINILKKELNKMYNNEKC